MQGIDWLRTMPPDPFLEAQEISAAGAQRTCLYSIHQELSSELAVDVVLLRFSAPLMRA